MPIYDYRCNCCGHAEQDVYKKMVSTSAETCPVCLAPMDKLPSLPHTDLKEFHKPIEMHSIAANSPEEIDQLRRDCPDLEISSDPDSDLYGVPIARNRKQKLAALKSVGFHEIN